MSWVMVIAAGLAASLVFSLAVGRHLRRRRARVVTVVLLRSDGVAPFVEEATRTARLAAQVGRRARLAAAEETLDRASGPEPRGTVR